MTDKTEAPPTIFGRPMQRIRGESGWVCWSLDIGAGMKADMYGASEASSHWYWRAAGSRQALAGSVREATAAIESRVRSLVTSLVPLLDDAGKAGVIDEGITKLTEAEKRAETAEREVTRLRVCIADMEEMMTLHPVEVEQARQEGYERGKSDGWHAGFSDANGEER